MKTQESRNLTEDITQELCRLLLEEPGILQAFLAQDAPLATFLSVQAYRCAHRNGRQEKRHRMLPLARPEERLEKVHLDWLDLSRLQEFERRLTPKLAEYFRNKLHPHDATPNTAAAATNAERQLELRLSRAWRKFDSN